MLLNLDWSMLCLDTNHVVLCFLAAVWGSFGVVFGKFLGGKNVMNTTVYGVMNLFTPHGCAPRRGRAHDTQRELFGELFG
mgnify:CR=1 FL=1